MIAVLVLLSVFAFIGIIVGGLMYLVAYNRLVRERQKVADAWSVIDLELQRRHQLIPMLVESVRASAVHERRILDELLERERAAAAAASTAQERSTPEQALEGATRAVIQLREMYPQLNSQQNFLSLQHELAITEDRISAARRFHNLRVADYNRRTESFPSNVAAGLHGFERASYFGER